MQVISGEYNPKRTATTVSCWHPESGLQGAYLGIIQKKVRVTASLCPMFSKPEKNSFSPEPLLVYGCDTIYPMYSLRSSNKLTVKNGLAESHNRRAVRNQKRIRSRAPRNHLLVFEQPQKALLRLARRGATAGGRRAAVSVHRHEVVDVGDGLDDVQHGLRGSEAVAGIERRPAVDVIDGAVERVRRPDRRVQLVPRHAVRAQQNVPGIPEDQGYGNQEPQRHGGGGRVHPFLLAGPVGAGRRGGRRRRSRGRGRWEIARMVSRGDHDGVQLGGGSAAGQDWSARLGEEDIEGSNGEWRVRRGGREEESARSHTGGA